MNSKYPNLLSPGTIGSLEIRNKTVMCAMGMSQSDQGFVNQAVINHYAERAKGGIGLIMVEVTCVDAPVGLNTSRMLVIDDDKYIPGLKRLADEVHSWRMPSISTAPNVCFRSATRGGDPEGRSPVISL